MQSHLEWRFRDHSFTDQTDSFSVYELAYSAMALATSSPESLPPSPQLARRGGASPCRRDDRTCRTCAHLAFGDDASDGGFKHEAMSASLSQSPIEMLDRR